MNDSQLLYTCRSFKYSVARFPVTEKLNHPNIVKLEVIRENDELFFVFVYMNTTCASFSEADRLFQNQPFEITCTNFSRLGIRTQARFLS